MKKKLRDFTSAKHRKFSKPLIFAGFYIFFYLIAVFILWACINISFFQSIYSYTGSFVKKDTQAIYNDVFITAYNEGKKCMSLETEVEKKTCYEKTSRIIAEGIHEETLLGGSSDDLVFVKPEDGKLYSLGWSGEVKDITETAPFNQSSFHVPQTVSFLTRSCHYFGVYDNAPWGCEVYIPLNYSGGTFGYVVRMAPLSEETWIYLVAFWPIVTLFTMFYGAYSLMNFLQPIIILVPALLAAWATKRYYNKD